MKRVKKMNSGGFVGKKKPDEDRPINERLAEREFRGDDGDEGGSVRLMGVGGRGGPQARLGLSGARCLFLSVTQSASSRGSLLRAPAGSRTQRALV